MAKLTAKKRNALPAKDFAGPDRSFPVDTPGRARSALGRSTEFHPELKAKIKAKVHKKFPGIQMSMDGGAVKARADRPSRH